MLSLTDFADQAVMLPLAAVLAVGLAISRWWRGLFAWLVAVVGVLGTIAVLKFVFFACSSYLGETGIFSPSGHTAAASAIYGGALLLALRGRVPLVALALIPPSFTVVVGITRLALGAHDLVEVLAGGAVGLLGAATLFILAGLRPPMRIWPFAVAVLLVIAVFHGRRLEAEGMMHNFELFRWLPLPSACEPSGNGPL